MKKFKKVFITALIALAAACAGFAVACTPQPAPEPEHEHAFGEWTDMVNTCTDHVQKRVCADCDFEETRTLETDGHNFGNWVDVVDTCTEHIQSQKCADCDFEHTRTLETAGHEFETRDIVNTCTSHVVEDTCKHCGYKRSRIAPPKGHSYGDWEDFVVSCTHYVRVHICSECARREYEQYADDAHIGHKFGEWKDAVNTCTEHTQLRTCSACGLQESKSLPVEGHHFVADRCVDCGLLGYDGEPLDWLDEYNSAYGLAYFKANKMYKEQALYQRIDEQARIFHVNTNISAEYENVNGVPSYIVSRIEFADLGLDGDRAASVWKTYKYDNPLFYWISNGTAIEDGKRLILICYQDYALGQTRATTNEKLYPEIDKYLQLVKSTDGEYVKALAFHDEIIKAIDYAYKPDNVTPSDEAWAHNVIGVFEGTGGTCEAYTRAYQLLLNKSGVENICVTGTAGGEGHSWNLVKLDDGKWYWCDLTWDDTPNQQTGISYNYFLVNDTQDVSWKDGGFITEESAFLDSHTFDKPDGEGVQFLYPLPARSESVYSTQSNMALRRTFNTNNAMYAVTGYKTVQLTYSFATGAFEIPETVTNSGVTFTVTSIGSISEGLFRPRGVLANTVTSVTISKTVTYIWDNAFNSVDLQSITVDAQNIKYNSVDGVLFYNNGEYLVQYPCNREGASYVIPDGCVEVVSNAFSMCMNLKSFTIGKDVEYFGVMSLGTRYEYSRNYLVDDLPFINMMVGGKITVAEGNTRYFADDKALYLIEPVDKLLRIECIFDSNITAFTLAANVFSINSGAFDYCFALTAITVADGNEYLKSEGGIVYDIKSKEILVIPNAISGDVVLQNDINKIGYATGGVQKDCTFYGKKEVTSVTFGKNVTKLGSGAFAYCSKLTTINYGGTVEEWKAIEKADNWCSGTGNIRIVCTNGTCDKSGNVIANS